jgi:hypothetical protein
VIPRKIQKVTSILPFQVSYSCGDGNDLTLTVVP